MASSASAYIATSARSRSSSSARVSRCQSSRSAVSASSARSGSSLGSASWRSTASTRSVGSVPSRNTARTANASGSYPWGTGRPGSTAAPPRGTSTPKSRSAQFVTRACCGAARCSTTRCRSPGGSQCASGTWPRSSGVIASWTTTWTYQGSRAQSRSRRRTSLSSSGSGLISPGRSPDAGSWFQAASGSGGQNRVTGDGQEGSQGRSASATRSQSRSCVFPLAGERASRARTVTPRPSPKRVRDSNTRSGLVSSAGSSRKSSMPPEALRAARLRRSVSSAPSPT